ncbi:MAG: PQQ-binding-like beta-propeller repeat protein [Acidobacteriota bacterium]
MRPPRIQRRLLFGAACLLIASAASAVGLGLDLEVRWPPVVLGGTLYLFGEEGRMQILSPGEAAPQCSMARLDPTVAPVSCAGAVWVLDGKGLLWRIADGLPKIEGDGLEGAVALLPGRPRPAVLCRDRLILPSGDVRTLSFPAASANALADGGWWVRGGEEAARFGPEGDLRWTWAPKKGSPESAVLAGDRIYTGTSSGALVALADRDGRLILKYRAGGGLTGPPAASDGLVFFATTNHFVRALRPSGQVAWHYRTEGRPAFGPWRIPQGLLLAEAAGNRLVLLSPADGKAVWTWRCPEGSLLMEPVLDGSRVWVLAWGSSRTPWLHAVDLPSPPPSGVPK